MSVEEFRSELVLDAGAIIGEGPVWDQPNQRWLWVDLPNATVYSNRTTPSGAWAPDKSWKVDAPACIVVPRSRGGLVVAAGTKLIAIADDGTPTALGEVSATSPDDRFNDGKCDAMGRLWLGTLSMSGRPDAALYRFDADGSVHTMLSNVRLSNGLDWSPDGRTFYHIDSMTMGVDGYEFDMARGTLGAVRRLITFEPGFGLPDGLCVDEQGYLWVAVFMGGEIRRYAPDGTLAGRVAVSARQTTSCAFGGPHRDEMAITTAKTPLPDWLLGAMNLPSGADQLAMKSSGSGGVFMCRPGVRGPIATAFAG